MNGLTFGGILRSEWIKLRSLRSTIWCYSILVAITFGLGLLFAAALTSQADGMPLNHDAQQAFVVQVATLSISLSQLVVVVLGALVITGEYGTGMIRSTFAAVPSRVPAVVAKALVFGAATFVVGLVSVVGSAVLAAPILAAGGIQADFTDTGLWLALIGAAGYLALIGFLALSIGTLIRNSAGAIATVLGLILVVPTIVQIFALVTQAEWAASIAAFLPSEAGAKMFSYSAASPLTEPTMGVVLEPWQGLVVLLIWIAVFFTGAALLLKRRDA